MAYGFEVRTAGGVVRAFDGSWLFKYHSTHTITAPADGSTTKSISGFDPNTWGVNVVSVTSSSGDDYSTLYRVNLNAGSITVYASHSADLTVTLHVLKA